MESRKAAAQIELIWAQVVRTERFRGYRPVTAAATGLLGLAAAVGQPFLIPAPLADVDRYLLLWVSIAIASVLLVLFQLAISYARSDSQLDRRLTRQAVQQFAPCLIGGAIMTWMIADYYPASVPLMPGLWGICFALGIFASIPFITPAAIWVGCFYLVAGAIALVCGRGDYALSPWLMGGMFGLGQILMASVLAFAEGKQHVEA